MSDDTCTQQQANAWSRVWDVLMEHNPSMCKNQASGLSNALDEIRRLQAKDVPQRSLMPVEVLEARLDAQIVMINDLEAKLADLEMRFDSHTHTLQVKMGGA